ncbi:hypothetical protein BG07_3665 [Bacillus pseudomycoides]|uniref:hypothetical protein n=1 Tax=Bacillus TaxID=1386 RepID=UPI00036771A6|nr:MULTISPECIES: hypothetical protein [Bacillus]AIK40011.1 hypothetical protein DJ92_1271 [Bacillus pseudomycoides]AJI17176.1 hypothetical protein BG07_3665 [Bacillus pseudomycoides]
MKKIGLTITGLALAGIMTFGVSNNPEFSSLNKGDTPAPQRPDLALNIGDTPAPADNGGDTPAPAYDHGQPWGLADGNTGASIGDHGGIVAQDTHADL